MNKKKIKTILHIIFMSIPLWISIQFIIRGILTNTHAHPINYIIIALTLLFVLLSRIKRKIDKRELKEYLNGEEFNETNSLHYTMNNGDGKEIEYFDKKKYMNVYSIGDNCLDKKGKIKKEPFILTMEERKLLKWFIENIKIEDYKKQIQKYCNEKYSINRGKQITEEDVKKEIEIVAIAINLKKEQISTEPDIAFIGFCNCDEKNGISIGFKNNKLFEISDKNWASDRLPDMVRPLTEEQIEKRKKYNKTLLLSAYPIIIGRLTVIIAQELRKEIIITFGNILMLFGIALFLVNLTQIIINQIRKYKYER